MFSPLPLASSYQHVNAYSGGGHEKDLQVGEEFSGCHQPKIEDVWLCADGRTSHEIYCPEVQSLPSMVIGSTG